MHSVVQHFLSIYYVPGTVLGHGDAELTEHQPQLGEPQGSWGDRWSRELLPYHTACVTTDRGMSEVQGVILTIFGSWLCELLRDAAITHSFAPSRDELR